MNEHTTVSAKQLCTLVFLSLAVDMAVRPFTSGGSAGAQIAILAAVLNTAVVSILLLPVLGVAAARSLHHAEGRCYVWVQGAAHAFGGAVRRRGSGSDGAFRGIFSLCERRADAAAVGIRLFLLVVFYALRCGLESIVRVLGLAAGSFYSLWH